MKPFEARPLIGDIAAQRLWGKAAATPRVVMPQLRDSSSGPDIILQRGQHDGNLKVVLPHPV